MSSDSEGGGPAGGGGPPQVRKTPPKALARARQQTQERKERLDSIREKVKNKEQVTNQEIAYLRRTKGTKKILESLNIVD
jgi:biotin synthase-related radical SAM superfamily protein